MFHGGLDKRRFLWIIQPTEVVLYDGYSVVSCHNCGFVYASGIPEQTVFNEYYKKSNNLCVNVPMPP
jgi:hypothetical protein